MISIETKYNIGDDVYYVCENKIYEKCIVAIDTLSSINDDQIIEYRLANKRENYCDVNINYTITAKEFKLFKKKEEAIADIVSKL